MNEDCIFCKIVEDKADSFNLYEDDLVKAFLDIYPVIKGHILVIPKEHYVDIFDAPDEVLERMNVVCRQLAMDCKHKLNASGVNILNASGRDAQQSVFHLHYHIVPRYCNDEINLWFHQHPKSEIDLEAVYKALT